MDMKTTTSESEVWFLVRADRQAMDISRQKAKIWWIAWLETLQAMSCEPLKWRHNSVGPSFHCTLLMFTHLEWGTFHWGRDRRCSRPRPTRRPTKPLGRRARRALADPNLRKQAWNVSAMNIRSWDRRPRQANWILCRKVTRFFLINRFSSWKPAPTFHFNILRGSQHFERLQQTKDDNRQHRSPCNDTDRPSQIPGQRLQRLTKRYSCWQFLILSLFRK